MDGRRENIKRLKALIWGPKKSKAPKEDKPEEVKKSKGPKKKIVKSDD